MFCWSFKAVIHVSINTYCNLQCINFLVKVLMETWRFLNSCPLHLQGMYNLYERSMEEYLLIVSFSKIVAFYKSLNQAHLAWWTGALLPRLIALETSEKMYMPPVTKGQPHFTKGKVREEQRIAKARIHVEMVIQWMNRFKIFKSVILLTMADATIS